MAGGNPERRVFAKGAVIFREGDTGHEAYLIQKGAVRIFKSVSGRRVTLAVARPFQVIGELAMMDDGLRMASAMAEEDTVCVSLSKASIRSMLDQAPEGLPHLIASLIASMRAMGDELANAKAELAELGRTDP